MNKRQGISLLILALLTGCNDPFCVDQLPAANINITAPNERIIRNWTLLDHTSSPTAPVQMTYLNGTSFLNGLNVLLPLDPNASQTRYSVQIDGKTDTLTIRYNLGLGAVSQRCGYSFTASRPAQGDAVSRRLGKVDSVFYSGERGFGDYWFQNYQLRIRLSL